MCPRKCIACYATDSECCFVCYIIHSVLFFYKRFPGLSRHISRKRRALKLRRARRLVLLKSVFTYSTMLKIGLLISIC